MEFLVNRNFNLSVTNARNGKIDESEPKDEYFLPHHEFNSYTVKMY